MHHPPAQFRSAFTDSQTRYRVFEMVILGPWQADQPDLGAPGAGSRGRLTD